MSLTKEAIQEIGGLYIKSTVSDDIQNADCPLAVLPDNFSVKSLEHFNESRFRFRGEMKTTSIDDFVRYSAAFSVNAHCFINAPEMSAKTIFNMGTLANPGHADNTATVKLIKTAPFKSLLNVNGERISQKTFAEWLEDWKEFLSSVDSEGNAIDIKKAIGAVRKITIESSRKEEHESNDFKASRSAMENVEAKSNDIMPAGFIFKCVPYEGLLPRDIHTRLSILTGGDTPTLVLRVIQQEALEEWIATEFKDLLINKFDGSNIETFIGSFSA